jgi:hypothetical protein
MGSLLSFSLVAHQHNLEYYKTCSHGIPMMVDELSAFRVLACTDRWHMPGGMHDTQQLIGDSRRSRPPQ